MPVGRIFQSFVTQRLAQAGLCHKVWGKGRDKEEYMDIGQGGWGGEGGGLRAYDLRQV